MAPLPTRMIFAWGDLRGSFRAEMARAPAEGALFVMALLSGAFFFLGRVAIYWTSPDAAYADEGELLSRVGGEFAGALIFRTLMLYLVAGGVHLLARWAGGVGTGRETRGALFWAALIAAPIGLAGTLGAIALGPDAGGIAPFLARAGDFALILALAHCLAEAHGFASAKKVLIAVGAPLAALAVLLQVAALG